MSRSTRIEPAPAYRELRPYRRRKPAAPVDLWLDGNEGLAPPVSLLAEAMQKGAGLIRGYPDASALEGDLAGRLGVGADQVLVTTGADDALHRACRAVLTPGARMLLTHPTFPMLAASGLRSGAELDRVRWTGGAFPVEAFLAAATRQTRLAAVVTPNNPTGAVASASDLQRISSALPESLLVVDMAYAEFADEDLTSEMMTLPNALMVRTLSKAWGLAGLRVGYVVGPSRMIEWLRAAGEPYPVAAPCLEAARLWLNQGAEDMRGFVRRVRTERDILARTLDDLDCSSEPSQGNFVLARCRDASWLRQGLAGLGIAVRDFPEVDVLEGYVRITCPGDASAMRRLKQALRTVLAPEAILFDMDGVLVDVRDSYRRAIVKTAAHFGVSLSMERVSGAKAAGNASNDWVLTRRLLLEEGCDVPQDDVTRCFEDLYQGTAHRPGLRNMERPLVDPALLARLARRLALAVVTGRPRRDARRWLDEQGLSGSFRTLICMEDAPAKPDPAPVLRALEALGVQRAWMVGDTPDDIRAARGAGVMPLGFDVTGSPESLLDAGAARILTTLDEMERLIP